MYSILQSGNNVTPYVAELMVDTPDEIAEINIDSIRPGSTCIVTSTSEVFMLNNKKEWAKL